jgi:predicted Zn-ribbon and HTH transcriptional regulator
MGMNSVLIVLNDHLDSIARDPEFGAKVADAVMNYGRDRFLSHAGARGFGVVSVAHADYDQLVRVGGNRGELLDAEEEEAVRKIRAKRERAAKKTATRPEQQRDQAMLIEPVECKSCGAVSVNGGTIHCARCYATANETINRQADEIDSHQAHISLLTDQLAWEQDRNRKQADEIAQLKAELAHHMMCRPCAEDGCQNCYECKAASLIDEGETP